MIRFSKREDYTVMLVHALAQQYGKRLVPLSEIASRYKISVLFLRNLANELRQNNIIKATEGKNGGYFLEKDPKTIKIGDILSIFTNKPMLQCCAVGKDKTKCPKEKFCEPGHIWRRLNKEFLDKIYNLSVTEFMSYRDSEQ